MSLKGIHYGKLNVGSEELQLLSMGNDKMFGVSFNDMKNVAVNKNDIIIETAAEELGNEDCMCEIRFYVDEPKDQNAMEDENKDQQNEQNEKEKESYTQALYKSITEKAKIGQFAGDSIATLIDVNLAVPRGKYTIDFYKKNFRLHGASYSYNVDYKHINKGFILPMTIEGQVAIVLQLHKDKPLYQGQTVYRYIVIQVKKDLEVEIKSKLHPEVADEYPHLKQLKPEYNGYLFQVFVDLIQTCSQINIIHPGNNFKSRDGQPCVKCNVKAQPGWLYMLKQSLIFIMKPVIYFKTDEIRNVEFTRTSATSKQFDIKIFLKEEKEKKVVEFMGIERPELEALVQYFKQRNVKIDMDSEQASGAKKVAIEGLGEDDEDSEEDEDFDAEEGDDDDDDSESEEDEDFSGEAEQSSSKQKSSKKKGKKEDKDE